MLDQEPVVAIDRIDHVMGAGTAGGSESPGQFLLLIGRVQEVCGDRHGHRRPAELRKGRLGAAAAPTNVVEVHRSIQHQVAVRIEALRKLLPVMIKIRLDLESSPLIEPVHPVEWITPETFVPFGITAVMHQRNFACNGQTPTWAFSIVVVVTPGEVFVVGNSETPNRRPPDLLGTRS